MEGEGTETGDRGETQFLNATFGSLCTIIVMKHQYCKQFLKKYSNEQISIPHSEYADAIEKDLMHQIGTGFKLGFDKSIFEGEYPSCDFILTCAHVMTAASEEIITERQNSGDTQEFHENWYKAIFAAFKVHEYIYMVVSLKGLYS